MTNEETKHALFEAFSAGNVRVNNAQPEGTIQERFDEWYAKTDIARKEAEALRQRLMQSILNGGLRQKRRAT